MGERAARLASYSLFLVPRSTLSLRVLALGGQSEVAGQVHD